jgi:hypothetical protein
MFPLLRLGHTAVWIRLFLNSCFYASGNNGLTTDPLLTGSSIFEFGNLSNLISKQWAVRDTYQLADMAAIFASELEFHKGEDYIHKLMKVPPTDNPTSPFLTPFAANLLLRSPLVALGTLDAEGRPWTTLWGGEPGFSRAIAQSVIGLKTTIERTYDPVVETLFGGKADGEVIQEKGKGKMVSGLAIHLESRKRVKLYGRMVAGALSATEEGIGEVQLVVKIEQSLGRHHHSN